MSKKTICSVVVMVAITFGMTQSLQAAVRTVQKTVQSGVPTKVFTWYNCITHKVFEGTLFVQHGTLEYRDSTTNVCGTAAEPSRELWYTSTPGFRGADTLSGRGIEIDVTVN
jgi:hypothetical protein